MRRRLGKRRKKKDIAKFYRLTWSTWAITDMLRMFLTLSIWRRMSSMVNCWDGEVALVSFGVDFDARIHLFGLNLCVIAEKKNLHEQHVNAPRRERPERPRELESNPTLTMVEDFFWFRLNYWTRVLVCAPSSNWRDLLSFFDGDDFCLSLLEVDKFLDFFPSLSLKNMRPQKKRVTIRTNM